MAETKANMLWRDVSRLLPSVAKPGRYVGGELNQIVKPWDSIQTHVALVFPDIYDLGQSNLGMSILYDILNQRLDVAAERAFAPWLDMETALHEHKLPLFSLENKRPLAEFDILGVSLPYETLYTNFLNILDLSQIPLYTRDRDESHPLVVAGGQSAFNPEPVAAFVDAFVVGEGEEAILEIVDAYQAWRDSGENRQALLTRLAGIPGIYVPSLYDVTYHPDGTIQSITPNNPAASPIVTKRILAELPQPLSRFLVPNIEVAQERVSVEIMRGCTRGCRFCHAGMVNRPIRERPVAEILTALRAGLDQTGYEEVSLLSLSSSVYTNIIPLIEDLRELLEEQQINIALPSLRIEKSQEYNVDLGLCRETGRNVNIIPERTYFSYGQIVYRGQQVHLYGRIHVDQKNAMLWKDYGLEGTLEACRVTALPLQTSSRVSPGTGISAIELQTALREGVFVPYQKQQAKIFKSVSSLFSADQGGMIYQPLIGLHRNVVMIDYLSMYPAIMVYYNISPETITTNVNNGDIVPTLSFAINKTIEGLVPKALRPLLEKRIELKKRLASFFTWSPEIDPYTRTASALKWLLVVCFGYLGYKNARFGRIEAHQAVTAYSREALLLAKEAAEDLGYQVIHMYVDGLWVRHPDRINPEDIDPLLVEIQKRTGLPIALDGIFKWVVFVRSRGNRSRPVANRYFGVFQNGKIKFRGIDARRHDCTPFVGQSQLAVIKLLANRDDPADALPEAVKYIRHRIEALQQGDIPLEDLIVKQRLNRQLEAYRSPSPAARAAIQLAEIGKEVQPGQKAALIHTLGKPGVIAWDLPGKPDPRTLDVERYKNLLLRAAGIVLETWGLDKAKLRDLMITPLFQLPLYRNQSRNKKVPPIPFTRGSSPDRRPNQQ